MPKPTLRPQVVASLRAVFDAPDRPEAERPLEIAVKKYRTTAPSLAAWLEANVPQGLTIFALPVPQPLPITIPHTLPVEALPTYHRDPFDRLLIAQARHEGFKFVSRDPHVPLYGVAHIVA